MYLLGGHSFLFFFVFSFYLAGNNFYYIIGWRCFIIENVNLIGYEKEFF